jgi:transcription initiation factor TFIIIB Brf1 subunit/transcription initiation factor TFIIB
MDDIYDHDNYSDNFDELDILSDDKLWDILDNFSSDQQSPSQTQSQTPSQSDTLTLISSLTDSDTMVEINKNSKSKNKNHTTVCIECDSKNIIFTMNHNSFVCSDCGIEVDNIVDESPEWNSFDGKGSDNRCGLPTNIFFPSSSLGTVINAPGYSKVKMLKSWDQMPYKEKSLADVLNEIDTKCKKYKISKAVIDNAKILYRNMRNVKNADKTMIIRGINRKQIIGACFYFGAILQKSPRSSREVADIFDLDIKQVSKGCRKFLKIMKDNFIVYDIKPSHGSDFVDRFGSKLKLPKDIIALAKKIAINSTKLDFTIEHNSISVASASILLSAHIYDYKINRREICDIFKISDVTTVKAYNKIYPYKSIITSDELTENIYQKMNLKLIKEDMKNDLDMENDTETSELSLEIDTKKEIFTIDSELDESDVIKKDDYDKKKQLLKEHKTLEKSILKESKINEKKEKKDKKDKKEKDEEVKRPRGRPKKVIILDL